MSKKIVGVIGSYRRGRVVDTAIKEVLRGAKEKGAEVAEINLLDKNIELCDNCRACLQDKEGLRGVCRHDDDMEEILKEIDSADGVILGSPVNFGTVTALMKRFVERLVVYCYWPWGAKMPGQRSKRPGEKKAVIVTSSACPAVIGWVLMPGARKVLKMAAAAMGAKVVKQLYFGPVAVREEDTIDEKAKEKCRRAGARLTD
jgi:NAD(P)H-dependent FMN reductase